MISAMTIRDVDVATIWLIFIFIAALIIFYSEKKRRQAKLQEIRAERRDRDKHYVLDEFSKDKLWVIKLHLAEIDNDDQAEIAIFNATSEISHKISPHYQIEGVLPRGEDTLVFIKPKQ